MRKSLIIFFIFSVGYSYCQNSDNKANRSRFVQKIAIFDHDYQDVLLVPENHDRFTPDTIEINNIENVLCKSIRGFRNDYRQYVGYIDTELDSIVIVNILTKKAIKKNRNVWRQEFIFGFGSFYEKNQRIIYYSLSQNRILKL